MTSILIVDVNSTTAYRIKKLLDGVNVEIAMASTIFETLNKIGNPQNIYDLFIVEAKLGSEDGFELINRVREIKPNAVFIIVTGLNVRRSFVKAIRVGASDYILKPFTDEYMRSKLMQHIQSIEEAKLLPSQSPKHIENALFNAVNRAVRERYELMVGLIIFYHKNKEGTDIEDVTILKSLFNALKDQLGEDDEIFSHGTNGLVIILPKKGILVKQSLTDHYDAVFKNFLIEKQLPDTSIAFVFVSLPTEVDSKQNALTVLAQRIEKKI
jgi:PleD family two-component response regulator